jgi:hypothetical protein
MGALDDALAPLGAQLALMVACALVNGRGRARRGLAFAIAGACALVPWLLPERLVALRAVAGLAALLPLLRTIELSRAPGDPGPLVRLAYVFVPLDVAQARRAPPALELRLALRALAHGVLASAGIALAVLGTGPVRWAGAALALYGLADAISSSLRVAARALGIHAPEMQRHPVLAETVRQFWGERWNRAVGGWLRRYVFTPVARRHGATAGTLAAFVASAAIHFYPAWIAIGVVPALAFGGYFLVQALLVLVEARLRVARWPRAARHLWTITCVLGPSPLFLDPLVRAFGG